MKNDKLKKKKIAFVSPRYGLEVNGGAELYCRQLAEKLVDIFEVEVITTCAIDYISWKDEYKEGEEELNGVTVRRFKVDLPRNIKEFDKFTPIVLEKGHTIDDEIKWMNLQGPTSSKLVQFISDNKDSYCAVIFIPYLYYTTFFGMQAVQDKCILIPAAHDEPFIKLEIFKKLFNLPKAIIYLTDEEKAFVNELFINEQIPNTVIGTGIDIPEDIDSNRFRLKYSIFCRFMLYIGRVDESKGCKELFDYFIRYKQDNISDIKLVLMGKAVMEIPKHPDIIPLGFVSDADKFDGITASEMLVLPSKYESLSIVVLESMALGRPVVVDGNCIVTSGHCIKGNAGLYYMNYNEFEAYINLLLYNKKLTHRLGINGSNYVKDNYQWNVAKDKLVKLINKNPF